TYLVTNPGNVPLTVKSLTDDAGTPTSPADDFQPVYVSGDTNNNGLLDPGEAWLYTSQGVVTYSVQPGLYGNTATVTGTATTGQTATARDPSYLVGTTAL